MGLVIKEKYPPYLEVVGDFNGLRAGETELIEFGLVITFVVEPHYQPEAFSGEDQR